jgi:hypothetical protein
MVAGNMTFAHLLLQAARSIPEEGDWVTSVIEFLDTPLPYSPLSEYLVVLFLLWLLARRQAPPNFDTQAQEVLEEKHQEGELTDKAYEKFRQDLSLRPRK